MRFFFIETLGDVDDPQLCFLEGTPRGIGVKYSRLCDGRPILDDWPSDTAIHMAPENPGIKLSSLIGNTQHFLLVHRDVKEVIEGEHTRRGGAWPIEYLPITIINHKGRPHSRDYFFVNPLSVLDVINPDASDITYFTKDPTRVVAVGKLVLDPDKLPDLPPIFRITQDPDEYVIDENLHRLFQGPKLTNLRFREIEQQPRRRA